MSLNFFRIDCQHPPLTAAKFGLCDKNDSTPAWPDTANPVEWIATVVNPGKLAITFTAVDNCVLKSHDYRGRGRCDVMLTTSEHLYLVELKDKMADWKTGAIDQLLSTIDFLLANHDISRFKKRKAFAANKQHRKFAYIDNEENKSLFRRTGFRLDSQAEILLVS
jgi:hypothetical protein